MGAPKSSMRASIPPRRYDNNIAITNFICELSSCFDELKCDTLMEENDVWVIVPFEESVTSF